MSKRIDDELDEILLPLKQLQPSREQVARWQASVPKNVFSRRQSSLGWVVQLGAAVCVGFIVGALVFKSHAQPVAVSVAENFDNGATVEMVYLKSN